MNADFLTRKLGPLPVWTYLLAAAAVLGVIALYRRGQSTMQQQAGTPSSIPASPYASSNQGQLNYPPTVVVTPAGVSNTSSSSSTTPASSIPDFPAWLQQAFNGTRPDILSGVQQGRWADVTGQYAKEVAQAESAGQQGGSGGGSGAGAGAKTPMSRRPVMGGTIFTRPATSSQRWDYFTPFQPTQYVDGRGGANSIGHVSSVTGIAAARLKSLNYHLRRPSGTYGPGIIRIG